MMCRDDKLGREVIKTSAWGYAWIVLERWPPTPAGFTIHASGCDIDVLLGTYDDEEIAFEIAQQAFGLHDEHERRARVAAELDAIGVPRLTPAPRS